MLLIIQIVLGLAFIGLLILAIIDAIKGTLIILAGLVLIAAGYTLKGISYLIKNVNQPKPVAPVVLIRKGIASENNACRTSSECALNTDSTVKSPQARSQPLDSIKGAFAGITLIFPARMNSYTSSPRLAYITLGFSPQNLHATCFVNHNPTWWSNHRKEILLRPSFRWPDRQQIDSMHILEKREFTVGFIKPSDTHHKPK